MKKRVFSIFLVFVMVLGMLPGTTLAAETVTIDSEDAVSYTHLTLPTTPYV